MIQAKVDIFPLAQVFRISRGARTQAEVVSVVINRDNLIGHGECVPYARYNETSESVIQQIESLPSNIDRKALQNTLPAGAARNAVDCALWDLECKRLNQPCWQLAGIQMPKELITAYAFVR